MIDRVCMIQEACLVRAICTYLISGVSVEDDGLEVLCPLRVRTVGVGCQHGAPWVLSWCPRVCAPAPDHWLGQQNSWAVSIVARERLAIYGDDRRGLQTYLPYSLGNIQSSWPCHMSSGRRAGCLMGHDPTFGSIQLGMYALNWFDASLK